MFREVEKVVAHWILFGCESCYKAAIESGMSARELGAICFAVREIFLEGRQYADVAFEFGLSEWQLRRWIRAIKHTVPEHLPRSIDETAQLKKELAELREEHRKLKEENERLLEEAISVKVSAKNVKGHC